MLSNRFFKVGLALTPFIVFAFRLPFDVRWRQVELLTPNQSGTRRRNVLHPRVYHALRLHLLIIWKQDDDLSDRKPDLRQERERSVAELTVEQGLWGHGVRDEVGFRQQAGRCRVRRWRPGSREVR